GYASGAINVIALIVTDPIEVCGLREDNPDQRGKREGDQKFLRLQTEAQTIHGGRKRESRGDSPFCHSERSRGISDFSRETIARDPSTSLRMTGKKRFPQRDHLCFSLATLSSSRGICSATGPAKSQRFHQP